MLRETERTIRDIANFDGRCNSEELPWVRCISSLFKEYTMTTKKTLITKFYIDVSRMGDEAIDTYKTLLRFAAKKDGITHDLEFELLIDDDSAVPCDDDDDEEDEEIALDNEYNDDREVVRDEE
jgi:hypothetical protein